MVCFFVLKKKGVGAYLAFLFDLRRVVVLDVHLERKGVGVAIMPIMMIQFLLCCVPFRKSCVSMISVVHGSLVASRLDALPTHGDSPSGCKVRFGRPTFKAPHTYSRCMYK